MFSSCLIAFLAAAVTDIVMTRWVKAVALDQALKASVLSMMLAMMLLTGVNEALHNFTAGVFWVLGYGAGSYIAVKWQVYVKAKTA